MLLKILVIFLWISNGYGQKEHRDWELAVVINDQIELLQSNGTLIGETVQQFTKLKALTFDNVRHQFVVSDMDENNDTIFTVQLTKEIEITPIITDLPDDVQGLAIDPIEDILYWTDSVNKTINYVYLNNTTFEPKLLFSLSNAVPQGITIDVCRRYIYWTNRDLDHPTIERAFLNGSNREVVVDSDLKRPVGIAVDYKSQRVYWADMREGIYYRIESANLNGKEREIVYEGTHSRPFGIAVDETSVYWTDTNNNALWRYYKTDKASIPEKIREFREQPMGLLAKNVQIKSYPDCKELELAVEKYGEQKEYFETVAPNEYMENMECLNGGQLIENGCKCKRGFTGLYCEIEKCHNFCIHGYCHLSTKGYPQCRCPKGFGGARCELDMCNSFCLNEAVCSYSRGDVLPSCQCTQHYTGSRCEVSTDFGNLCRLYCRESVNRDDYLVSKDRDLVCRCEKEGYNISKNNLTVAALYSQTNIHPHRSFLEKFASDSDYTLLVLVMGLCFAIIIGLAIYILTSKNYKRPIIKKRVIVNKNITPLTYRPQHNTEQCEITIENCCNMNVCETPCFEPAGFRGKNKEDKKNLLSDMENGEEIY